MPTRKVPKTPNAGLASPWEEFASMSRAAVSSTREPRAAGLGVRVAAGTRGGRRATSLGASTRQAIELGRKQAAWVVDRRQDQLAARAKAVSAAAKPGAAAAKAPRRSEAKAAGALAATAARAGTSRGVLIAEGDSWFDYPFHDVLKELDDDFGWEVEHVAHYGHTVESMAYDGGQLDDLVRAIEKVVRRGQTPQAILLSGGGNDVAGEGFAMLVNHRSSPIPGLNEQVVKGIVEARVRTAFITICAAVTAACERLVGQRLPILVHAYDYPVPDGRGLLGGWGPLPGPWLQPGFVEKGYQDLVERIAIIKELIDGMYTMLGQVAAIPELRHVEIVNLRNTLSTDLQKNQYKKWWGNELHPTRQGFEKVAGLFNAALERRG